MFGELFASSDDPWGYLDRWYEQRKRALSLAALPRPRYRRAFEPGCANGVLSAALAERCQEVVAADAAGRALQLAARRVPANVRLERLAVPAEWPSGSFDLIVVCELGYYLDRPELKAFLDRVHDSLEVGGTLLAVHWRHPIVGWPLDGAAVHDAIAARPWLTRECRHEERDFLLEVFAGSGAP